MIEIAFAACLTVSPYNCRDNRLTFNVESVSLFECMIYGQFELVRWNEAHPQWRIAKWTCRQAKQVAKI